MTTLMHSITQDRPTKKQRRHRSRPNYPELKPDEKRLLNRPECGKNIGRPVFDGENKGTRYVLTGKFVFSRELPARARSKYAPTECDAKKGFRQ